MVIDFASPLCSAKENLTTIFIRKKRKELSQKTMHLWQPIFTNETLKKNGHVHITRRVYGYWHDLSAVGSGCWSASIPSLYICTVWLLTLKASVATCVENFANNQNTARAAWLYSSLVARKSIAGVRASKTLKVNRLQTERRTGSSHRDANCHGRVLARGARHNSICAGHAVNKHQHPTTHGITHQCTSTYVNIRR